MTIYDIAIVLIPLLALLLKPIGYNAIDNIEYKSTKKYLILIGLILTLIPGLRHLSIGLDTFQYEDFCRYLPDNLIEALRQSRFEGGYVLLNFILRNIGFVAVQIAVSASLIGLTLYLVRKYSPNIWFSCFLFVIYCFYYRCFNEMRQAVALGIICFSFQYIVNKDLKRFVLCMLAAVLFHRTSIIFAPAVVLIYIDKIKWWLILGLMGGLIFLTMYATVVIQTFLSYFSTDYSNMEKGAGGWGLFALQILTFSLALLRLKYLRNDRINIALLLLVGMAVIIFPICHINPMLFRLQDYYWIYMILLVPRIIKTFKSSITRIGAMSLYSFIGYIFVFNNFFSEHAQTVPYVFFFE